MTEMTATAARNEKGSRALTRKSWLLRKAAKLRAIPNAKGEPTTSPTVSKSRDSLKMSQSRARG
jgi:hypothetical protein